jgi:S1-C subfamily serine protease
METRTGHGYRLAVDRGGLAEVQPNSPVEKEGIEIGHFIVAFDGDPNCSS